MNNATGRLFLKASHKATAFSGILLQHGKQWSCATAYQAAERGEEEGGGELLGFICFTGEGNVLWSKGRNVRAVMRINWSYFGRKLKMRERSVDIREKGWVWIQGQLRNASTGCGFGLSLGLLFAQHQMEENNFGKRAYLETCSDQLSVNAWSNLRRFHESKVVKPSTWTSLKDMF